MLVLDNAQMTEWEHYSLGFGLFFVFLCSRVLLVPARRKRNMHFHSGFLINLCSVSLSGSYLVCDSVPCRYWRGGVGRWEHLSNCQHLSPVWQGALEAQFLSQLTAVFLFFCFFFVCTLQHHSRPSSPPFLHVLLNKLTSYISICCPSPVCNRSCIK